MSDIHQVIMLANTIKGSTEQIRDTFPDNLPYLWDKLSPMIDNIETCCTSIKMIAKEIAANS